jgi:uncharacterized protein (DUF1810 family)
MTTGRVDLERFVAAQDPVFDDVCAELAAGSKRSHWMWFIFPQLRSLGRSSTAQYYGIADRAEAEAYWQHPVLGPRLVKCAGLVLAVRGKTVNQIFGSPDDLKLRSCMTLFEQVAPGEPAFGAVLDRFYNGGRDQATLTALGQPA